MPRSISSASVLILNRQEIPMADYVSAHILIGGDVRQRVVPKLCEAIRKEGVSLEWGELPFRPDSAAELGRACQEIGGKSTLRLCCDEVADGEFASLQAFLVRHKLPFNRWHESKYEIPCELLVYRPGGKPLRYPL
jgi:hypothetical protein